MIRGADREKVFGWARAALADLEKGPPRGGIDGYVGDALFAAEVSRFIDVDPARWRGRAVQAFNEWGGGPSLHRGLAGLGFVLAPHAEAASHLEQIDRALLQRLQGLPAASVQRGVAGVALYASLRSGQPSGRALQRAAIDALAAAATPSRGGVVWLTPGAYARRRGVGVLAEPVLEYGPVHGVSGTLVALAALAREGHRDAAELVRAGLRAAWAWERPGANRFGRIAFGAEGEAGTLEFDDNRWCVGDPGVLRALWVASNVVEDAPSAARALALLREDAERDASGELRGTGRIDLCCGAGVVAQAYWRTYLESGDDLFRAAHERLLGYCAERLPALAHPGFAYGRAGAILSLLAPLAGEDPRWDGILGIRIPHCGAA